MALFVLCGAAHAGLPSREGAPAHPAPPRPLLAAPADTAGEAPLIVPGRPAADTAAESRATKARAQLRLGQALESQGMPGPAIMAYRNATLLEPSVPEANYRMGLLFLTRQRVAEATQCFALEVKHHPGNLDARRELGLGLARLGKHPRAIAELGRVTRERPGDGEGWRALGFAYSLAGRDREAEQAFRRALRLPPERADEHRDLGVLLAHLGRTREARAEYRRAVALDPKDGSAWLDLANLERREGRLEQALADYREAEARDSSVLAMRGQIEMLAGLERQAEAGEVYRRWLKAHPEDHDTRLAAVRWFDGSGRKDVALEIARDGVRHDAPSGVAHLILGMALEASGETRAALFELREAESLYDGAGDKDRIRRLISAMRAAAADSLKALFEADSVSHGGAR